MDDKSMFFMLTSRQKKRKRAFFYETLLEEEGDFEDIEGEYNEMINNVAAAVVGSIADKPPRKPRGPDRDRNARKILWEELYHQKTDEEFVEDASPTKHIQHHIA